MVSKFIFLTFLTTVYGAESKTSIKASDITALRVPQNGIGCAVNHKDIERELLVKESCEEIEAKLNARAKPAAKRNKNLDWSKTK